MDIYYATKMMEARRVNLNVSTSSQLRPNVKITIVENFKSSDIRPFDRSKYRAGIIPYYWSDTLKDNVFALAVDGISGDLTDFGGKLESDEDYLDGAFREFHEETVGTLLPRQDVQIATQWLPMMFPDNIVYYDDISLTLMYRLPDNFDFNLGIRMFNKLFDQRMNRFLDSRYDHFHRAIPPNIKTMIKEYHASKGERVDLYKKLFDFYGDNRNHLSTSTRGTTYPELRKEIWNSPFENSNIKLLTGNEMINHLLNKTPQKLYDKVRNLISPVFIQDVFGYNPYLSPGSVNVTRPNII